jgi:hypothetical protein
MVETLMSDKLKNTMNEAVEQISTGEKRILSSE